MSYSLIPYTVEVAALRSAFGSKDRSLNTMLCSAFAQNLQQTNEWFKRQIAAGAPRLEDALAEIIEGTIRHPEAAYMYGYALEILCRHLGQRLQTQYFNEMHDPYLDLLDKALKRAGLGKRFIQGRLLGSGPPIRALPRADDFPVIGHLLCAEAEKVLSGVSSTEVEDDEFEVAAGATECLSWLEYAVSEKKDLVFFHY